MSNLVYKVNTKQKLTDQEKMQFIILPLSYEGLERKRDAIQKLFELAKKIEDAEVQIFLVAGMIAFSDKVIDKETTNYIRRWIGMMKIQSRKVLKWEGLIYLRFTMIIVLVAGNLSVYVCGKILQNRVPYFQFRYPLEMLIGMFVFMGFLCVVIPNCIEKQQE